MTNLWTKYAHLGNPLQPRLHPLTPQHIRGDYEKGRWARANGVNIRDCPYATYSDSFQEWYVGFFDEDDAMQAARVVLDSDFEEFV